MATTIGVSYDPKTTAAKLAQQYMEPLLAVHDAQNAKARTTDKGLADLLSALSTFQSSLSSLTGLNKTMFAQSASLSDTTLGSATANANAAPGTYHFFVEQLATSSQVSYNNLSNHATNAAAGTLGIKIGSSVTPAFTVDLATADADSNGTLTPREIAVAINKASGNASKVSASVVTVGTSQQLMLTSQSTGAESNITLDTSGVGIAGLKTELDAAANRKVIVAAQDAIVWLGAKTTGTQITQATNTFTNIEGVTVTFTKAQASGASPMTITVGQDTTATTKNVRDFLDAYNKLKSAVDALIDAGDPETGKAAGAFAHDSGIRALRDRLVDLMRPAGSTSLASYGITAAKDGTLVLKEADLLKKLAADPTGLDTLIGSTATGAPSAIANRLNAYIKEWTDGTNGRITKRDAENDKTLKEIGKREVKLEQQYETMYKRYLIQFTQLQTMQSQMQSNMTMFDALFGSDKK